MAKIRITRELLEHLLDLPANVTVVRDSTLGWSDVEGEEIVTLLVDIAGNKANGSLALTNDDRTYALQYTETEIGTSLVSAIPVSD